MTKREVLRALDEVGVLWWHRRDCKVPAGWNSVGCVAWRSNRPSHGEDHDTPEVRAMFEAEGEPVEPIGVDCEFGDPTTLFSSETGRFSARILGLSNCSTAWNCAGFATGKPSCSRV